MAIEACIDNICYYHSVASYSRPLRVLRLGTLSRRQRCDEEKSSLPANVHPAPTGVSEPTKACIDEVCCYQSVARYSKSFESTETGICQL